MAMPQLVATAWTSAGDTSPMRVPSTSPVPIAERVAAIADAGYVGMGLVADDLLAIRDTIGFNGLRDLIADHGITHVEIELIERWWIPRGEPGNSYELRDLLLDAADVLAPAFIKIGSDLGPRISDPRRSSAHSANWPLRRWSTAPESPSRRCRSRSSRRCRWAPKSSRPPHIPESGC